MTPSGKRTLQRSSSVESAQSSSQVKGCFLLIIGLVLGAWFPGSPEVHVLASERESDQPRASVQARPAAITFVAHAIGAVTEPMALSAQPGGGALIGSLPTGANVAIGGITEVRSWLRAREVYWLRSDGPNGPLFGFAPAGSVVLSAGEPPHLDLTGVSPAALLAPESGMSDLHGSGDGASLTPNGRTDHVGAPELNLQRTEFGGDVDIPWLPGTIAPWKDLLVEAGRKHNVDPDLLAIIVLVESGGNPNAVSRSGAVGLMQLMPSTAAGVAAQLGTAGFSREMLYDPAVNIDFGASYLAQQLRAFGLSNDPDWQQSVALAAAAYNGGPGHVTQHLTRGVPLVSEAARYQRWVAGQWRERHDPVSPTFSAWWDAGGRHLVAAAEAELASG